jgi:hypothetical protein
MALLRKLVRVQSAAYGAACAKRWTSRPLQVSPEDPYHMWERRYGKGSFSFEQFMDQLNR